MILDAMSGSPQRMMRRSPSPRRTARPRLRGPFPEPGDNGRTHGDVARHEEAGTRARLSF